MRLPRLRLTAAVLAVCVSALTLGIATPAEAHKHPTPAELIAPAVVRIMTYGKVSISLIEHNFRGSTGNDISLVQRSYQPMLGTGSGFVVNPSGTIITSPTVTGVDLNRAAIFAVNKIFNERYGDGAPMPADPYTKAKPSANTDDVVSKRLQRCYQGNTTDETGGCVIFTQAVVTVQPFVSDQKQFGDLPAQVVYPTGGKKSDVAVLKVGASSMPSVVYGNSADNAEAVSTLGFTNTPTDEKSLKATQAHFTKKGSGVVRPNDDYLAELNRGFTDGMSGGPVVSEKGQVIGFLAKSGNEIKLVGPDQIAEALAAVDVKAERGPTDLVYENALHNFNNQLYTAAAPNLSQVLKLYPGHALASQKLTVANQRKGTSADKGTDGATDTSGFGTTDEQSSGGSDGSSNILLWGGLGAIVVLAVLLGAVLLRGRGGKGQPETAAPPPDPNLMPGYGQPGPPMPLGAPYPGAVGSPASAPPATWPTSAPPGWVDPRQPGTPYPVQNPYPGVPNYSETPYGAPASGVPYADPNGEQQTVLRLSPSTPPPIPGQSNPSGATVVAGEGTPGAEGAPAGVMARQGENGAGDVAASCDQCGQTLVPGQQFCGYCGNRVH
ncbi:trypsin-like peptidase domain-containing protein [Cryptosporangium aurantiacum]|uniref:Trypsin-like peptidase domain-containing protein n=1 Tax=Cryptosporangium aurantiacum TaxID=134849 RepID=A0A1M7QXY8_9ACTN|nr:trypsin-like peptidase domain-containing protein [Cryptosporangium aurantiacum]SHN36809.1 Trypsin-like peptidase domain-containing protein [Cryptosporangium aurantiacum]